MQEIEEAIPMQSTERGSTPTSTNESEFIKATREYGYDEYQSSERQTA